MLNRSWKHPLLALLLSVWALSAGSALLAEDADSNQLTEEQKIQALIERVSASGAVFIRNGSEHSAEAAAAHMRMKLSRAGGRIKTAEHFIKYIATKSSFTGIHYRIRLPDGKEVKSADWLRAQLTELEAAESSCCSLQPPA